MTVKVWFATVKVPLRAVTAVLAPTLYCNEPFPLPLAPEVMASHGALLVAVQAQPACVSTDVVPVPPVPEKA